MEPWRSSSSIKNENCGAVVARQKFDNAGPQAIRMPIG